MPIMLNRLIGGPAWLEPGGAGFSGRLFALAPALYQADPDETTYFMQGVLISAPKLKPEDDILDYFYAHMFAHMDQASRLDIRPIYTFLQSVRDGTALLLSPDTPRPEAVIDPVRAAGEQATHGLMGSDDAAYANATPMYGPMPNVPYGVANQVLTREQCEDFYRTNPALVRPPNYPV